MRKLTIGLIAMIAAAPSVAAPVSVTAPIEVRAKVVKPLTFTASGTMNFGTIILNGLTANRTISLSTTNVRDCGGGTPQLICSGATGVPTYNLRGTNGSTVTIIKTASNLTNAANGATLRMSLTGPNSITFNNSSSNGVNFTIGGSITLTPTTSDGVYSGTVNVQVDYQ
jgi:spore coat protein U-like protein